MRLTLIALFSALTLPAVAEESAPVHDDLDDVLAAEQEAEPEATGTEDAKPEDIEKAATEYLEQTLSQPSSAPEAPAEQDKKSDKAKDKKEGGKKQGAVAPKAKPVAKGPAAAQTR